MNKIKILRKYKMLKDAGEPIDSLLELQTAFAMTSDRPKKKITIRQMEHLRARCEYIDQKRMILG